MPLALTDRLSVGHPVEGRLRGSLPVTAFPRLAESLSDTQGNLAADLQVSRTPDGVALVEGSVVGCVRRDCQRCLEPVDLELDVSLKVAVTGAASEELAPPDFEPWQTDELDVTLGQLLEDELILALPMVARHEDEAKCGRLAARLKEAADDSATEKESPFAVLRSLKRE